MPIKGKHTNGRFCYFHFYFHFYFHIYFHLYLQLLCQCGNAHMREHIDLPSSSFCGQFSLSRVKIKLSKSIILSFASHDLARLTRPIPLLKMIPLSLLRHPGKPPYDPAKLTQVYPRLFGSLYQANLLWQPYLLALHKFCSFHHNTVHNNAALLGKVLSYGMGHMQDVGSPERSHRWCFEGSKKGNVGEKTTTTTDQTLMLV